MQVKKSLLQVTRYALSLLATSLPVSVCLGQGSTLNVVTGTISLAAPGRFYFDALANLPNTLWSLSGPQGVVVTNRSFTSSDAQSNQVFSTGLTTVGTVASPISLPASGVYTLLVEGYIGEAGSRSYTAHLIPQTHS